MVRKLSTGFLHLDHVEDDPSERKDNELNSMTEHQLTCCRELETDMEYLFSAEPDTIQRTLTFALDHFERCNSISFRYLLSDYGTRHMIRSMDPPVRHLQSYNVEKTGYYVNVGMQQLLLAMAGSSTNVSELTMAFERHLARWPELGIEVSSLQISRCRIAESHKL